MCQCYSSPVRSTQPTAAHGSWTGTPLLSCQSWSCSTAAPKAVGFAQIPPCEERKRCEAQEKTMSMCLLSSTVWSALHERTLPLPKHQVVFLQHSWSNKSVIPHFLRCYNLFRNISIPKACYSLCSINLKLTGHKLVNPYFGMFTAELLKYEGILL